MEQTLIEDVRAAVRNMVELMKTYRSKKRFSQVMVSTMFMRRLSETETVIDRAILDIKVSKFARFRANSSCWWVPYIAAPLGYAYWRVRIEQRFFFNSTTDAGPIPADWAWSP